MGTERFWQQALAQSEVALAASALVPLATRLEPLNGEAGVIFEIRHLTGVPPRHLRAAGPKPNPFRPWDPRLQVDQIGPEHVLILNKYPVQIGHMLLISRDWAPQIGWLGHVDWQAVACVDRDTSGLWFFNSGPIAGASQPHRHLQLLPRRADEPICPRANWFLERSGLSAADRSADRYRDRLSASCVVQALPGSTLTAECLGDAYRSLCSRAGLGTPELLNQPARQYNILLTRQWMALILRSQEGVHGFSVNALGFAGYLLSTSVSELEWLEQAGPDALLREVVPQVP